jgi:rRNA maturation protein Nop10
MFARAALVAPLVVSAIALSGCMSSPTYGTDKTAAAQLLDDVSGAAAITPKHKDPIDYKPRPDLVKPAPGQKANLPPPQQSIETASADWPESPEARRARIRADATTHQNDPNYQPEAVEDVQTDPEAVKKAMAESGSSHPPRWSPDDSSVTRRNEVQRRLAEQKQGDPTTRKYLSEPPLAYRQAADTAPQNELGEDEYKKERRLKAQAEGKKGGWFDWLGL